MAASTLRHQVQADRLQATLFGKTDVITERSSTATGPSRSGVPADAITRDDDGRRGHEARRTRPAVFVAEAGSSTVAAYVAVANR